MFHLYYFPSIYIPSFNKYDICMWGGFDELYYNKILVEVESNFRGDKIIL